LKAAVYNRFLQSMGGGERHSSMIAQVLAADGYEVDLVAHEDVGKEILADHLGLDLGKVALRIVKDRGEADMARISAEYDLFVNGSYMSRVKARAAHNIYMCYFPTPFDHDLSSWRRRAIRTLGPYLREARPGFFYGTGWFPSEGGLRRTWAWTSGEGLLYLPAGEQRKVAFDLGRPGGPGPADLVLRADDGRVVARLVASTQAFQRHELELPSSARDDRLVFESDTFVPGGGDDRSLGVAISRMRLVGAERNLRQRVVERFPWLRRDPDDLSFLEHYDRVLANSEYTRSWIERLWHIDSDVLFPPIRVHELHPGAKERKILTVGRFFAPGTGHCKKQLEQVQAFGRMLRRGGLDGWELHVVGGVEPAHRPYLAKVRRAAEGLPVFVHANAPRPLVDELFATSAIFWSATGYGEDVERQPWAFEHFGITTVEAMAAGCVPAVIDKAGQRESVRQGVDGYRWSTLEELEARTRELAGDPALRERMAASAIGRAQQFSEAAFAARWRSIATRLGLPASSTDSD
jgi:glycosyltransferase involved in cell wall biosynthesis